MSLKVGTKYNVPKISKISQKEGEIKDMGNHRKALATSSQIALLGNYEDKYTQCLKMLLEDCQEEMFHIFSMECGSCILKEKCSKDWTYYVCNHRGEIKPEEFVDIVHRFVMLKKSAREQFRYKRTICLRLTTSS